MAKIKGFKNPDLDFIEIQVIQISFKQYILFQSYFLMEQCSLFFRWWKQTQKK